MKKEYIIGGLALLGIIGVVSYLRKPKKNSEGFFNAGGSKSLVKNNPENAWGVGCAWCKSSDGKTYHTGTNKTCNSGDRCSVPYSY